MANYNLVSTSKFSPFSFEELLRPALMETQAHRELEDQYTELATKANVWKKLASDERDKNSKAYEQYRKYSEDLNKMANTLAKEGLNASSRQQALSMKGRYSSDITPIEEAYVKRDKLAEEQRQARLKDPTLMYDVDYSLASIDDIIANTSSTYSPVSGKSLYDRGIEAGKSSSLRRVLPPEIQKALGNQYFELTERRGYSATEAANFLANQNNIPELKEMIDNIINQSGANVLNSKDKQRALDYAINGAMVGLSYNEDRKYMKNEDYLNPYEQWKWNKEKKGDTPEIPKSPYFDELVGNVDVTPLDDTDLEGLEVDEKGNLTSQAIRNLDKEISEYRKNKKVSTDKTYKGYELSNRQLQGAARIRQFYAEQSRDSKEKIQSNINKYAAQLSDTQLSDKDRKALEKKLFDAQYQLENYDNPNSYLAHENEEDRIIREKQYKRDKMFNELRSYAEQYSHLSSNPIEAAKLGKALSRQKSLREHSRFGVFTKEDKSEFKKAYIETILNNAQGSKVTGIYDEEGKQISREDLSSLRDQNLVPVVDEKGLSLVDEKGNEYVIRTTMAQKEIAKEIKDVDSYMTDFSKSTITNSSKDKEGYLDMSDKSISLKDVDTLTLMQVINSKGKVINRNSRAKGITIKDKDGQYYKAIIYGSRNSPYPKIMITSISDVIGGGHGLKAGENEYLRTRLLEDKED